MLKSKKLKILTGFIAVAMLSSMITIITTHYIGYSAPPVEENVEETIPYEEETEEVVEETSEQEQAESIFEFHGDYEHDGRWPNYSMDDIIENFTYDETERILIAPFGLHGTWLWPVPDNRFVFSPFNVGNQTLINIRGGTHRGIDISSNTPYTVVASRSGTATVNICGCWNPCGHNGGFGNFISINHGGGYVSFYAHLQPDVRIGNGHVNQGTAIATTGNTGRSGGRHLHFEIRHNGTAINTNPTNTTYIRSNNSRYSNAQISWGGTVTYTIGSGTPPQQPTLSVAERTFAGAPTTFYANTPGAVNGYTLYIYRAGQRHFMGWFPNGTNYIRTFTTGEIGFYSAYIVAHTSVGDVASSWVAFGVFGSPTTAPVVTVSRSIFGVGETVDINWTAVLDATQYGIIIYGAEQGRIVSQPHSFISFSLSDLRADIYTVWVNAINPAGLVSSNVVRFQVVDRPPTTAPIVTVSRPIFGIGETVDINWTAVLDATQYGIIIYGAEQGRIVSQPHSFISFSISNLRADTYTVWVNAINPAGLVSSNVVHFQVVDQCKLLEIYTQTTVTQQGQEYIFSIDITNPKNGVLIVSTFNSAGVLTEIRTMPITSATTNVPLTFSRNRSATNAKVMIWDGFNNMSPLNEPEYIILN